MAANFAYYVRLLTSYYKEVNSNRDLLRLLRVRLARSKVIGRFACPHRVDLCLDIKNLGHDIHIRSHTSDISVLDEVIVSDGYTPILKHVSHCTPKTIVDLGANIGLATRWFAEKFPGAQFIAVEPDLGNFQVLRKNSALLPERIRLLNVCAGAISRNVSLDRTMGEWSISMRELDAAKPENTVKVMTMPEIVDSWQEIDLLKCDIEGAERELFGDCGDWINRVQYMIVECHGAYREKDLMQDLERNGAKFEKLDEDKPLGHPWEVLFLRNMKS